MNSYMMVVLIVAMAMAVGAYQIYLDAKVKAGKANKDDAALHDKVAELEARIVTLERISTDPGERLKRSIGALEDA